MKHTKIRGLVAATESTYNTAANFNGSDAIVVDDDIEITPLEGETLQRKNIQPYPGMRRQFTVNQAVKISFSVELATSGAAGTPPRWGRLLKACGWSSTVIANTSVAYNLLNINQAIESVTLVFEQDGTRHVATGCQGTLKLSGKLNDFAKITFEFMGNYANPIDTSMLSPSWANQAAPLPVAYGNTTELMINSWSGACLSEFEIDLKNELTKRNLANCSEQIKITDRNAEGKLMIEAPALADQDFFSHAKNSAVIPISFKHADASGGKVAITIPNFNVRPVKYTDLNGVVMLDVSGGLLPSSAGKDELSLLLTGP